MKKLIPISLLILISCGDNTASDVTKEHRADTIMSKPNLNAIDIVDSVSNNKHLGAMFDHTQPFEIVSFQKGITLVYTGSDDTSECRKWDIKRENLLSIFKNSEPIDGTTWDLAFAITPCVATGQLKQKNELFDYSINAGSWFSVTCRDTTMLFGDYNKNDRKFFLANAERH